MYPPNHSSSLISHLIKSPTSDVFFPGGLFLDPAHSIPPSFVSFISSKVCTDPVSVSCNGDRRKTVRLEGPRLRGGGCGFLSVSLSVNRGKGGDRDDDGYVRESGEVCGQHGNKSFSSEEAMLVYEEDEDVKEQRTKVRGSSGALNTTKHLWAGAFAAMVSRFAFKSWI